MTAILPLAPVSKVDAALNYADYAAGRGPGQYPDLWLRKYPEPSAGDKAIELPATATRPEHCMQILAAEVRRLRAQNNHAEEASQ